MHLTRYETYRRPPSHLTAHRLMVFEHGVVQNKLCKKDQEKLHNKELHTLLPSFILSGQLNQEQ